MSGSGIIIGGSKGKGLSLHMTPDFRPTPPATDQTLKLLIDFGKYQEVQ